MAKFQKVLCLLICLYGTQAIAESTNPSQALPPPVPPTQPPASQESRSMGFYYYCGSTKAYYPTVASCPEPWIAIPLAAPPAVMGQNQLEPKEDDSTEPVSAHPNAASLEVFGRASIYSLDFDRAISDHITLGAGIAYWDAYQWWPHNNYEASITVIPVYMNYYFTQDHARGFISAGADFINASQSGLGNGTFTQSGVAAVLGGGFECRNRSNFLFRLGGFLIVGRTTTLNPSIGLGIVF